MLAVNASTSSLRGSTAFSASGPSRTSRSLFLMTFSLRLVSSSRCYKHRQIAQDNLYRFTLMESLLNVYRKRRKWSKTWTHFRIIPRFRMNNFSFTCLHANAKTPSYSWFQVGWLLVFILLSCTWWESYSTPPYNHWLLQGFTLRRRFMSASMLEMVILCMMTSEIRRSRVCHLLRATLVE